MKGQVNLTINILDNGYTINAGKKVVKTGEALDRAKENPFASDFDLVAQRDLVTQSLDDAVERVVDYLRANLGE